MLAKNLSTFCGRDPKYKQRFSLFEVNIFLCYVLADLFLITTLSIIYYIISLFIINLLHLFQLFLCFFH